MPDAEQEGPTTRRDRLRGLTRAGDWWNHKVPVALAFGYVVLLGPGDTPQIQPGRATASVLAFLVAVVGVAGLGHVVNDLFDAEQDRRAGRVRPAAELTPPRRLLLGAVLVGCAVLPWLYLPVSAHVVALLVVELALLAGYSAPPLRAKERGALALVFDASYAFVVPVLLTIVAFGELPVGGIDDLSAVMTMSGVWALAAGARGIAFHQIDDLDSDDLAGADTWAVRIGHRRALRRVTPIALVEPALFATVVVLLAGRLPLLPWIVAATVAWRAFQLRFLDGYEQSIAHLSSEQRVRRMGFGILNDVYERWLPIIVVVTLVARDTSFWPLLVLHAVAFDNGLVGVVRRDLPNLPSLRYTRVYWTTYWIGRLRGSWVRRTERLRPRPLLRPRGTGRFVFVVCGPSQHIETLHTALTWLRPRTNQEIVVVTDSTRNEVLVRHDRIVEVATPAAMDDRQASIWLKTSLHRHVPADVTNCYLDTDIVAARSDVDEIFDHVNGPVTFALDRMIRENGVDRFSPAAMTCACTGVGEPSSCQHLREALLDKWGVEPPGDWMHWNGGVFLFAEGSREFLDEWHDRAVAAFDDPRFQTRDQHALIATVWSRGMEEQPCIPSHFNTIVDLGSTDITWRGGSRYAVHPDERPPAARLLHLYSNDLHDPAFDLRTDVEEVVLRQMARRAADRVRDLAWATETLSHLVRQGHAQAKRAGWTLHRRLVVPTIDVVRRAGRSVARRIRVLTGREPSPGGRRDALRFPKGWRDRPPAP